ncbi:hypothetical protein HERIO_796 [Hepatospora eriocheir]|uniref:Uncharacterized protein n=1 Tax=Hepatospora eriocheir TaxID=1081669 RepID=A0A1X0QC13_9MICR|nr:hypothetical protein HERIO_796 [Hepatospora eriocheir]
MIKLNRERTHKLIIFMIIMMNTLLLIAIVLIAINYSNDENNSNSNINVIESKIKKIIDENSEKYLKVIEETVNEFLTNFKNNVLAKRKEFDKNTDEFDTEFKNDIDNLLKIILKILTKISDNIYGLRINLNEFLNLFLEKIVEDKDREIIFLNKNLEETTKIHEDCENVYDTIKSMLIDNLIEKLKNLYFSIKNNTLDKENITIDILRSLLEININEQKKLLSDIKIIQKHIKYDYEKELEYNKFLTEIIKLLEEE